MITYFNNGLLSPEVEETEDGVLTKKALILASGSWIDSKKRPHTFSEERIKTIAFNTNKDFNEGLFIPILKDHNKDVNGYCGELNSEVEARRITEEDLPANSRHRLQHLVGRLGIFASNVLIKAKDVVNQVKSGLNTISPGIDITGNKIREISITPIPAIAGMSLFMQNTAPSSLTWDDLDNSNTDLEQLKEALEELLEKFYTLVSNIFSATEESLQGRDPLDLVNEAYQIYCEQVAEVVGLNDQEEDMTEEGYMPGNAYDATQQQAMQQQFPQYRQSTQTVGYSMGETMEYLAEYATEEELAEFGLLNWGKKVGNQLGEAYVRGRNVSSMRGSMRRASKDPKMAKTVQADAEEFLKASPRKQLVTSMKYGKSTRKVSMADRLSGAGAVANQVKRNVKKFYTKGSKPRWGNIAATGGVGATGVGTNMYLNNRNKQQNRVSFYTNPRY